MAAATGTALCILAAEQAIQIGMHGARNMRLGKHRCAQGRIGQVKAAVKHHQGLAGGLQELELFDADQVGIHGLSRKWEQNYRF